MAHTKVTKTYSQNTGAANTFSYSGSFDVFKATEVECELDNVQLTFTASTINESASPREYTVDTSAKTIHIGGADLSSGTIIIRPVTDMGAPTPRATYAPGSSVTSEDLNNNQTQLMRKAMEYDEQKLSSLGGTMTGHLTMGEDQTIIFEGATDDGYETTLTVTDPTADRTITLPNVTGTVVTTGDTATVTATMLAANSVDSSELVDGSIDTSHIGNLQVTTDKIAADAVTGAKIADDAIDSEHYTDGSIDTAHIADANITTAKLADNAVTTAKITDANVTTAKLAADAVTTAKITDANVTTAKIAADAITAAKIADDVVNSEHFAAGSIDTEHIADLNVTTAKIAADAITGAKIADDAIDSEHYTDGSIDTAHIGGTQVTAAKIASNAVTTAKITDANVTTAKIADDAITIAKVGCEQTTISDSDSHIPTSGAVVDYVAAQIAPIGGLEVIADEDNFPSTQPASGVVISISDAAGIVVSGSGSSTTARTAGNGSDNVTINNFPSSLYSETLASGNGLMVTSTGSSNVYNYHKLLASESDVKQLSDDINDFQARYRVNAGEPGSNNDEGDLVFDTSANKMKVYDGSSWGEVTSSGDFKYLVMTNAGTTNAATLNGSNVTFDLKETSTGGSAASVTSAAQLMVSVNGVVQKPNTGTNPSGLDGFVIADSDTITFCAAPASGDDIFIIQTGSAITPTTPADGTVTAAKIGSGAVTTAKIADDAVTAAKIADDAVGAEHIEVLDAALQFGDEVKAQFGAGNDLQLYHVGSDGNYSYITDSSGRVYLKSDRFYGQAADGANQFYWEADGATNLYYDGTKRFETTSTGAIITSGDGADTKVIGDFIFAKAGETTTRLMWDGSSGSAGKLEFSDSVVAEFGDGGDLAIYHDGNNSKITDSGTGILAIGGSAVHIEAADHGETMAKFIDDGACEFYHDNSKKLQTQSGGVRVFGDLENHDDDFVAKDNCKFLAGNDGDVALYHDGSNSYLDDTGTGSLILKSSRISFNDTSNNEWARINSSGRLLVGTTNDDEGGTANTDAGVVIRETGHVVCRRDDVMYTAKSLATGGYTAFRTMSAQTEVGNITFNSSGTSYNTSSDYRRKENIVNLTDGITRLKTLKPYRFNFKTEPSITRDGFLAHEVTAVPEAVWGTKDAVEPEDNDDKGVKKGDPIYQTIDQSKLVPLLTAALQEAITKIETLETKVAALEAK